MKNADGSVRHPGLDNHGMGSIFEELVRRFNEENNEEAGEHWTPRDAVRLMAKLVFLPVADEDQVQHVPALRRRLRHRRHADRGRGDAAAARGRARQGQVHAPVRPGDQRRDLRHLQGRPAAEGRGRRRRSTSSAGPSTPPSPTTPSRRASSTSCSRTRPTGRAGRATWSGWAARRRCATRAS